MADPAVIKQQAGKFCMRTEAAQSRRNSIPKHLVAEGRHLQQFQAQANQ